MCPHLRRCLQLGRFCTCGPCALAMTLTLPVEARSHTADSSRKNIKNMRSHQKNLHLAVITGYRASCSEQEETFAVGCLREGAAFFSVQGISRLSQFNSLNNVVFMRPNNLCSPGKKMLSFMFCMRMKEFYWTP